MRRSLVVVALLALSSRARAAETMIDDFEAGNAASRWTFYNGAEFPGATGSLTDGAPYNGGKGAALHYDLSGGGNYVSATRTLPVPLTAAAIAFWTRVPAGIHAKLRVGDSSGQTLQYDVGRPLEASDATAWYREVVALDAPSSHYGGANDGVVHQPVKVVTLMAADPPEPGVSGVISFDDVVAIDTLSVRIDPETATLIAPPPGSSDLASRIGVNIHFTKDDRALDLAKGAGFTRVRMDLGWSGVEHTKGVYDFSALDALVASLASRDMGLLLILDYFNPLYPAADAADYATTTVPAFAALAKSAATHFSSKNVVFEIWNEPNLDGFWPPKADATEYATLCKAAIAGVHAGNPSATVSTAGVSAFDYAYVRTVLAAGGGQGANAVGVHPYRQGGGESVSDDLVSLKAIVSSSFSPAPPIWATEWGYSSTWFGSGHDAAPLQTQAKFATRELLSAWALGFPVVIYYDIRDDGTDPTNGENNFGLVQNDYSDKPAMVGVRTLSKTAAGRAFAGFIPLEPSSLHAMRLDTPTAYVVALWSDAPNSQTTVAVPTETTGTDMFGAPLTFGTSGSDRTVVVREANGPVYLTFPRTTAIVDGGLTGDDGSVVGVGGAGSSVGGATSNAGGAGGNGNGATSGSSGAPSGSGGVGSGFDAGLSGSSAFLVDPSSRDSGGCGCTLVRSRAPSWELAAMVGFLAGAWRRRRRLAS